MATPGPTVIITRYEISCLPVGHPERHHFALTVERCRDGLWEVSNGGFVLDFDGHSHFTSRPEFRTDLETALARAKDGAPRLVVNGWTLEQVLADQSGTERNDPEQSGTPADATGSSRMGADGG
jgi:hypothetical protein